MSALPIGQVVRRPRAGVDQMALRFRAYGKRRYVTLGAVSDGWTEERALQELDRILDEVAAGSWTPTEPALNEVIRDLVRSTSASDPREITALVLDRASDEILYAELEAMVAQRVRALMHDSRRGQTAEPLDGRWAVPAKGWQRLGDCTAKDCDAMADEYELRACEMAGQVDALRALARALRKRHLARVGQLPPDLVKSTMLTAQRSSEQLAAAAERARKRRAQVTR